ncbi:cytochrome-ba3 oxidase subunit (plasmid) [Halarchaeum sp. CBA1220]|nr:cytochrome-ba3 oxidase subunit [Halarchaeum sp. CBA1220]
MPMADVPHQWLAVLALLALLPVAVYFAANTDLVVALTFVNVVLIAAMLYRFFVPDGDGREAEHA